MFFSIRNGDMLKKDFPKYKKWLIKKGKVNF